MDRKYYYCPNCTCVWYVGDDEQNKFYAWLDELSDDDYLESLNLEDRACGCDDEDY